MLSAKPARLNLPNSLQYTVSMADLSQSDVQRAVQDGVRNLRSDIQRLQMQAQPIDDIYRQVQAIQKEVNNIERVQHQSSNVDQRLIGVINDVHEMKLRIVNIERFCAEMSAYMREKHELEEEEDQYRAA